MSTLRRKIIRFPVLALVICGSIVLRVWADPMHEPTHMPSVKAESVEMSDDGLAAIDELLEKKLMQVKYKVALRLLLEKGKSSISPLMGKWMYLTIDQWNRILVF